MLEVEKTCSLPLPIQYWCKMSLFRTFPKHSLMQNRIRYNFVSTHWKKHWNIKNDSSSSFVTVHCPMGLIMEFNNMVLHLLKADACLRAWLDCSLWVKLVPKNMVLILILPIPIRSPLHYTDNVLFYRLLFFFFFPCTEVRHWFAFICTFLFIS